MWVLPVQWTEAAQLRNTGTALAESSLKRGEWGFNLFFTVFSFLWIPNTSFFCVFPGFFSSSKLMFYFSPPSLILPFLDVKTIKFIPRWHFQISMKQLLCTSHTSCCHPGQIPEFSVQEDISASLPVGSPLLIATLWDGWGGMLLLACFCLY